MFGSGQHSADKQIHFFQASVRVVASRFCCPACGHIAGARTPFEYPPIYETDEFDHELRRIYGAEVLCFCPDCESHFTFLDLRANDEAALQSYINRGK